jgi:cytochrome c peroxidase
MYLKQTFNRNNNLVFMRHLLHICTVVLLIIITSCTSDEKIASLDSELISLLKSNAPNSNITYYELPASNDFSKIPQDPRNPITKEKVALGGFLFHETGLAVDAKNPKNIKTFSCASCHHAGAGFQAGTFQGVGEGGLGFGLNGELRIPMSDIAVVDVQPLRSPSAMNGAYQQNQLWNGQFGATHLNEGTEANWTAGTPIENNKLGYEGLETQAIAGMTVHRLNIDETILAMPAYRNLFDQVFPDFPKSERYSKITAGLAIAAYERTLLANQAPFQKYIKGQTSAMNDTEKKGAILFFGKAQCVSCHTGPALNSMQFNAIGMDDLVHCPEPTLNTKENDPANLGRGSFTKNPADNYKFKVPQLYNLRDSPFYGHGSSLRSIRDVILYKNKAIAQNGTVPTSALDPNFKPLNLTNDDIDALEAFISKSLHDANLQRYTPQSLPSGLCFPNADVQSRFDMDCF